MNIFAQSRLSLAVDKRQPEISPKGTTYIDNFSSIIDNHDPGDWVEFIPDPENKYDPLAVRIMSESTGDFLGHLPKEMCPDFHREMLMGNTWYAVIDTIYPSDKDRNAGYRIMAENDESDNTEKIVNHCLNFLDVTEEEAYKTAESFIDFAIMVKNTYKITDNDFGDRVANSSYILLKGGIDIGLLNNNDLDDLAGDHADLVEDDPMSWSVSDLFTSIIPTMVILGVAQEDETKTVLSLIQDKDKVPTPLWKDNDPSSSLFAAILHYAVRRVSEPMGVQDVDLF